MAHRPESGFTIRRGVLVSVALAALVATAPVSFAFQRVPFSGVVG
jgi:hypothetical protein